MYSVPHPNWPLSEFLPNAHLDEEQWHAFYHHHDAVGDQECTWKHNSIDSSCGIVSIETFEDSLGTSANQS